MLVKKNQTILEILVRSVYINEASEKEKEIKIMEVNYVSVIKSSVNINCEALKIDRAEVETDKIKE